MRDKMKRFLQIVVIPIVMVVGVKLMPQPLRQQIFLNPTVLKIVGFASIISLVSIALGVSVGLLFRLINVGREKRMKDSEGRKLPVRLPIPREGEPM
jgi:hypothetical protein